MLAVLHCYHLNFNTVSCSKTFLKGCAGEVWEKNKIKKDVGETEEEQNRFKYFNGFAFVYPGKRFVPPPQTFKHLSRFGNMNAGRRSYSPFQEIEFIADHGIQIEPRTNHISYMNDVDRKQLGKRSKDNQDHLKYFTGFGFHSFGKTLLVNPDDSNHNRKNQAKVRSKPVSIYNMNFNQEIKPIKNDVTFVLLSDDSIQARNTLKYIARKKNQEKFADEYDVNIMQSKDLLNIVKKRSAIIGIDQWGRRKRTAKNTRFEIV